MKVLTMDAEHHDLVLAITSHLPHLIAYTNRGHRDRPRGHAQIRSGQVLRRRPSAISTRIAASDPVMWRDVFLNNREAVLEMLQRFSEDLTALQRAIRWGEGQKLEDLFTRNPRDPPFPIIEAKQA